MNHLLHDIATLFPIPILLWQVRPSNNCVFFLYATCHLKISVICTYQPNKWIKWSYTYAIKDKAIILQFWLLFPNESQTFPHPFVRRRKIWTFSWSSPTRVWETPRRFLRWIHSRVQYFCWCLLLLILLFIYFKISPTWPSVIATSTVVHNCQEKTKSLWSATVTISW